MVSKTSKVAGSICIHSWRFVILADCHICKRDKLEAIIKHVVDWIM